MLKHTRVSSAIDTARLRLAVEGPGIDTRCWQSLAIVTDFFVDPDHGPFVDILLLPDEEEETARVGSTYAGPGFGFYSPLEIDDEIIVGFPDGEPDNGLVVLKRLWSLSDPPPDDAVSSPADVLLHLKSDANYRIVTDGAGNVIIDPRGSGKVRLGGESGLQPAALGTDLESRIASLETAYNTHIHVTTATKDAGAVGVLIPPATQATGMPTFQATKVEVK